MSKTQNLVFWNKVKLGRRRAIVYEILNGYKAVGFEFIPSNLSTDLLSHHIFITTRQRMELVNGLADEGKVSIARDGLCTVK